MPDTPGHGKPSDHSAPFAKVHLDRSKPKEKNYVTKAVRPLPASGIREFGQWIQGENFECLTYYSENSSEQVAALEKLITDKIDEIFPRKIIKIFKNDKEFMNKELKMLKRQKSREYRRHKKSTKISRVT